ncbi:LysE family translocator [Paraburkholderia sp. ZP32-5]|uniref:LysE family translocator n=1 Tax=Paraburkholderia sp. ZP32-5 TaxID=2883245 RepID=UPI001F35FE3A|nr:LysE family translocator [Paraburkholderia sp. ZP32-5]
MLGISGLPLFIGSVVLLNLTPGPDMAYVAGQSLAHGRRAGILSALGVSLGGCMHTMACAFGVSAVIAASPAIFNAIRWVGAIYLVYLGVSTLRWSGRGSSKDIVTPIRRLSSRALLLRGFLTNVGNPKVLLFYIAFLPQFVETGGPRKTLALLVLGALMIVLGMVTDSLLACCAAMVARSMKKQVAIGRWLHRVVGATFVGIGIRIAITTR